MLPTRSRALAVIGLAALAAGCATAPPEGTSHSGRGYKVGIPYQIGDTWYYPQEQPDYDETGVASWYGPTFYGKPTANGEIYDGEGLTAAHRTLPMPVKVRVTNLENGKSLVLRVNDRGPFAQGRIIDVSKHAAELLGFYARGTARVRVTYLGRADIPARQKPDVTVPKETISPEITQAVAAAPASKVETDFLLSPRSQVQVASLQPPPIPARPRDESLERAVSSADDSGLVPAERSLKSSRLYIQVAAFSSQDNAERLKTRLADAGLIVPPAEGDAGKLHRVRLGPYDDLESANAALAKLNELGNNGAQIVVDR